MMTYQRRVWKIAILTALAGTVTAHTINRRDVDSFDDASFKKQYTINKFVERYRQPDNPIPDFNGLMDADGNTDCDGCSEPIDITMEYLKESDWVKQVMYKRVAPCAAFGIIAFLFCCVANCCCCRRFQYEEDGRGGKELAGDGCCSAFDKCCTPPKCASSSTGRKALYGMMVCVIGIGFIVGVWGLEAETAQSDSVDVVVTNLAELSQWVDDTSASIDGVVDQATDVLKIIDGVDPLLCGDAEVQAKLADLDEDIKALIGDLTSDPNALAEAAGAAGVGGVPAAPDINSFDSSALDEQIGGMKSMIGNLSQTVDSKVEQWNDPRHTYVRMGLGFMVAIIIFSAMVAACVGCSSFCKGRYCVLFAWSSTLILVMLIIFIIATVLLLAITLWADFCYDEGDALLKLMDTKDEQYEMFEYYLKCPTYEAAQYASDFPFKAEVAEVESQLKTASDEIANYKTQFNTCQDAAGDPLGDAITTEFERVSALILGEKDGLLSANGVIGCPELNGRLMSILDDMCNDIYVPFALFFELFFVVGWALLCSELLSKCLRGEELDDDADFDDVTAADAKKGAIEEDQM